MLSYVYWKMKAFVKEIHIKKLNTSDFSVQVWGLPPDALETEIIDHFSDLYNLQHIDWVGRTVPQNPSLYPVGHYGNTCDEYYYKKWVAEVTTARPIGFTIRKLLLELRLFQIYEMLAQRLSIWPEKHLRKVTTVRQIGRFNC